MINVECISYDNQPTIGYVFYDCKMHVLWNKTLKLPQCWSKTMIIVSLRCHKDEQYEEKYIL